MTVWERRLLAAKEAFKKHVEKIGAPKSQTNTAHAQEKSAALLAFEANLAAGSAQVVDQPSSEWEDFGSTRRRGAMFV